MSDLDNIDAPTWADFTGPSPQVCLDDYFRRPRGLTKYRDAASDQGGSAKLQAVKISKLNLDTSESDDAGETPKKQVTFKKPGVQREISYEKVISEAMSNLGLCVSKNKSNSSILNSSMQCNKSLNVSGCCAGKSCLIDSPIVTPIKQRVTRSICSKLNASMMQQNLTINDIAEEVEEIKVEEEPVKTDESQESEVDIVLNIPDSHDEEEEEMHAKSDDQQDCQDTLLLPSALKLELNLEEIVEDKQLEIKEEKQEAASNAALQSKIVTSFGLRKNEVTKKKSKPSVLTGTAWHREVKRRISIIKNKPQNVGYVGLAEAVSKFQRATPLRFKSQLVKTNRADYLRRASLKLTMAKSPALTCRHRVRPVNILSAEEREKLELEEMRQHRVKANPVPKSLSRKPIPKPSAKKITIPEPFHLTEVKKYSSMTSQVPEPKKNHHVKKTMPTIVVTNDKTVVVKDEEILHFGIPVDSAANKKKQTKAMPFSFEERNKAMLVKKEQKIKQLQEEEQKKAKGDFKARPIPLAVKTPANKNPPLKAKTPHSIPQVRKVPTTARNLSFEDRNRELLKKKEEKVKEIIKKESQPKIFHAQPVPKFKPVMVKGRSKDNLMKTSQENLSGRTNCPPIKPSIPFVPPKKVPTLLKNVRNQENKAPRLMGKVAPILGELNTDKRAKQRKDFDDKMKQKELEEEEARKKEEEFRLLKEKNEVAELRKMAEIKANPMPVYKTLQIMKSKKPLTEAQSPAWARKQH